MSEAENEVVEVEQPEAVEQATEAEPQAESAPAEGSEAQPEVDEAAKEQQRINEAFARKQAKIAKERKRAEEAEAKAKELEERLTKLETVDITVPDAPDRLDYDTDAEFNAAVQRRDQAIKQAAEREGIAKANEARQQEAQRAQQEEQQRKIREEAEAHVAKAKAFEIKPEELQATGQALLDAGINGDLIGLITADDEGPLIQKYLAANPFVFDEINRLPPARMGMEVERKIRPALAALKPKPSQAPDPATTLDGNGAVPGEHPLLEGATFK
jgi:hypothetical protein